MKYALLDSSDVVVGLVTRPDKRGAPTGEISSHPSAVNYIENPPDNVIPHKHKWDGSAFAEIQELPAERTIRLTKYAQTLRKRYEYAGASATLGNGQVVSVDTSRDDVAALTGVLVRAQQGALTFPLAFKGGGEFYDLANPSDLEAIATATATHVQTAYIAERAAKDDIDNGIATTEAEVEAAFDAVTGA